MMLSRVDKSPVATWWWTVDRWFLAAFLSLMGLGIVLSLRGQPGGGRAHRPRQLPFRHQADHLHRCRRCVAMLRSRSSTRGRSGAWR